MKRASLFTLFAWFGMIIVIVSAMIILWFERDSVEKSMPLGKMQSDIFQTYAKAEQELLYTDIAAQYSAATAAALIARNGGYGTSQSPCGNLEDVPLWNSEHQDCFPRDYEQQFLTKVAFLMNLYLGTYSRTAAYAQAYDYVVVGNEIKGYAKKNMVKSILIDEAEQGSYITTPHFSAKTPYDVHMFDDVIALAEAYIHEVQTCMEQNPDSDIEFCIIAEQPAAFTMTSISGNQAAFLYSIDKEAFVTRFTGEERLAFETLEIPFALTFSAPVSVKAPKVYDRAPQQQYYEQLEQGQAVQNACGIDITPSSEPSIRLEPGSTYAVQYDRYRTLVEHSASEKAIAPAYIAAILTKESSFGLNEDVYAEGGTGIAGCKAAPQDNDPQQITCAAQTLQRAFHPTSSQSPYAACQSLTTEEKIKCIFSVYNTGYPLTHQNGNPEYADEVYAYFTQWNAYLCPEEAQEGVGQYPQGQCDSGYVQVAMTCGGGRPCCVTSEAAAALQSVQQNPDKDFSFVITSAYRSLERQRELYRELGSAACNPDAHECPHTTGNAIDIAVLDLDTGPHRTYKSHSFTDAQKANHKHVLDVMHASGWVGYSDYPLLTTGEWWHFECCSTDRYARASSAQVEAIV